jgi:hypothetical protein
MHKRYLQRRREKITTAAIRAGNFLAAAIIVLFAIVVLTGTTTTNVVDKWERMNSSPITITTKKELLIAAQRGQPRFIQLAIPGSKLVNLSTTALHGEIKTDLYH